MLAAFLCPLAQGQDDRCGAGKDLVVQALERISPQSDANAFQDALQLLKHAVSECAELGDAWYYRSLVEKHLGHDALARYAMDKARFNNSEALAEGLDPLVLSTPLSRGLPDPTTRSQSSGRPPAVQEKWALVIGISRFADHAVPKLDFTTADAQSIADALRNPAIGRFPAANVHVLTNEKATTKGIKEELNWIARRAKPDDLVVIYVATHGTSRKMDSVDGANYLVTYDTEIYGRDGINEDALYATSYPMIELANAVATRMKSLRTAVILDTCYSAGSISGDTSTPPIATSAPSPQMLAHMAEGTGRIILAASRVNESSLESPQLKHGYFTYYFLKALEQGKGQTPLSQVFAVAAQQVTQRVNQHPVMSRSSSQADFALGAPAADSAVLLQPTIRAAH